jgi:hypothetical protein
MKSLRVQDAKGKSEPVLLGSLDVGDCFILPEQRVEGNATGVVQAPRRQ